MAKNVVVKKKKKNSVKKVTKNKPTKKPAAKKMLVDINELPWPGVRHVLYRTSRFLYHKTKDKYQGCVFCHIAERGIGEESLMVYETAFSMVVLNKFPYNNGHLMVLPKRHIANLEELSSEEFADLNLTVLKANKAIKACYQPQGINIGANLGEAAGAGIPGHLHFHVIPRWTGDLNFFPLIAETKMVSQTLEETYHRIQPYFIEVDV